MENLRTSDIKKHIAREIKENPNAGMKGVVHRIEVRLKLEKLFRGVKMFSIHLQITEDLIHRLSPGRRILPLVYLRQRPKVKFSIIRTHI